MTDTQIKIRPWKDLDKEVGEKWHSLILGSGASVALHNNFQYSTLHAAADTKGLLPTTAPIFKKLSTTNFENVLFECRKAQQKIDKLDLPSENITQAHHEAYSKAYDEIFSQPLTLTDGNGNTTIFTYDGRGNPLTITDPLGHTTSNTFNPQGQVTRIQNALGHGVTLTYVDGLLQSSTDDLGRTTNNFYDNIGRLLSVTNPLGNSTIYSYDALSRLTKLTNAHGNSIRFGYDANDNIVSRSDEKGQSGSFTYDGRNRLLTQTDSLGRTTSFAYEAGGLVSQKTDRKGIITGITYDALGRATQVGFGASATSPTSTIQNSYDLGDRLTQLVDSVSGTTRYTYDNLDRLLSETSSQGTVTYTYDNADRKTSMTVTGQPTVTYAYDKANRLTQIQQAAGAANGNSAQSVSFIYDAANRTTERDTTTPPMEDSSPKTQ